jgi:hypothetical protein
MCIVILAMITVRIVARFTVYIYSVFAIPECLQHELWPGARTFRMTRLQR